MSSKAFRSMLNKRNPKHFRQLQDDLFKYFSRYPLASQNKLSKYKLSTVAKDFFHSTYHLNTRKVHNQIDFYGKILFKREKQFRKILEEM